MLSITSETEQKSSLLCLHTFRLWNIFIFTFVCYFFRHTTEDGKQCVMRGCNDIILQFRVTDVIYAEKTQHKAQVIEAYLPRKLNLAFNYKLTQALCRELFSLHLHCKDKKKSGYVKIFFIKCIDILSIVFKNFRIVPILFKK